jgi:hypothetical protein
MERGPRSSEEHGRDEPIWVAMHKCMEAMLGIFVQLSLPQKCHIFLTISYVFSSTKLENKMAGCVLPGSRVGEV